MIFTTDALMILAVALASAAPCAALGCFLLLRRMSLLADGVAHGVLPGIVLAVMLTGRVAGLPILVGATLFGLLTALLAETLTQRARVAPDAGLGVVFTSLFALGVILLSASLGNVHIDIHCIAFSILELTPLLTTRVLGIPIPDALGTLVVLDVAAAAVLVLFWKELKAAAFDGDFARAIGVPTGRLHYVVVGLTAACTVAAFESFGSILILGMFVFPPATARLLTDRLVSMIGVSVTASAIACVLGVVVGIAFRLDLSASIVLAAALLFTLALLFAPGHGAVARLVRRARLTIRMAEEELLASLFRAEERDAAADVPTDHAFAPWILATARWNLARRRWVEAGRLTDPGRRAAQSVVRAHRLWESYLEKNFGLPLDHLHASATEIEHYLGPDMQDRLAAELGSHLDPHGRSIPPK